MLHKFGVFEFDGDSGELRKNGRVVGLEPQPAKALALLLSRAGDVVTREELRDAVWGADTHVDFDRGIAYCLSQIRTALGDSGENPRFVQTIPKRGIKFVAPVSQDPEPQTQDPGPKTHAARTFNHWVTIPLTFAMLAAAFGMVYETFLRPPVPERVVVAVSVFDNETGIAAHDRAVAGLSDLVVEHLARLDPDRVAVIGNAAVLRQPRNIRNLKAIAQNIRADYVLLGQLQQGEKGLRFITHVIRLRDQAHLKANRLPVGDPALAGLEAAVVEEFERAVREHVIADSR